MVKINRSKWEGPTYLYKLAKHVLGITCSFAHAEPASTRIRWQLLQEEMTLLEVVKLIEAETDEEGDILEELSNQDIKDIYQQLSHQDKKRFRQFRKFHRQYFGVYGEHLPSYHMARQVVKDLMPGLPSASADVIAEKRAELLAEDRLRELCRRHGFKFPEREMRMEAPREEAVEDPTYRFPSVQDEYHVGLTTTTNEEIRAAAWGRTAGTRTSPRCHPGY